jgi:GAF domain-containing protein
MAESLHLTHGATKAERFAEILPQIESIIAAESDLTANLANVAAILREAFGHFWIGFYIRRGDELVLGPFQGPLACTRIPVAPTPRGVCGAAAAQRETIVVPDVEQFPGHIACSSASRSEIVVPLVVKGKTELVLDVDSTDLNTFDAEDAKGYEALIQLIKNRHFS